MHAYMHTYIHICTIHTYMPAFIYTDKHAYMHIIVPYKYFHAYMIHAFKPVL